MKNMLKLIYYVPDSHLAATKQAVFAAGAGAFEDYTDCAWQVKGIGQFLPRNTAQPFIGKTDCLEQLEEWRVEMIVPEEKAKQVKQALLQSHPYEVPAFEFIRLVEV